jgi:sterol desaturase/sphingolipid hydroxylase (fatty acid hydroxylase superfamily)
MHLLSFEHSARAQALDGLFFGTALVATTTWTALAMPDSSLLPTLALVLAGTAAWSAAEYLLHRFVLHGLRPFSDWHAQHHARPRALIGTPTAINAVLMLFLVGAPLWLLGGAWVAGAVGSGFLLGYLAYSWMHHTLHHGRCHSAWMSQRKRSHAVHHMTGRGLSRFGVSTGLWDRVLRTDQ